MVKEIRGRPSPISRRGWTRFLGDHEITAAGLIEAMGLALDAGMWEPPEDLVAAASDIDMERRSRS